jgi:hypothetical protein
VVHGAILSAPEWGQWPRKARKEAAQGLQCNGGIVPVGKEKIMADAPDYSFNEEVDPSTGQTQYFYTNNTTNKRTELQDADSYNRLKTKFDAAKASEQGDVAPATPARRADPPVSEMGQYEKFMHTKVPSNSRWISNGVSVSGDELNAIKEKQLANRSPKELELEDFANQARASMREKQKKSGLTKAKGGKIDLGDCKVNTASKNKASPNW